MERPEAEEAEPKHDGAHFVLKFTKTRGLRPHPPELDVRLTAGPDGTLRWTFDEATPSLPQFEVLKQIAMRSPSSQKDLAAIMSRAKGTISKDIKKLSAMGLIDAGTLTLTDKGWDYFKAAWPDLFDKLSEQDKLI